MEMDQRFGTALAYLVHDLNDAAVRRRVDLFAGEGFAVGIGGFRRQIGATAHAVAGHSKGMLVLGRTYDARLALRALSVIRWLLWPGALRRLCAGAPVIVARNLEMLMLASRVRLPQQRLVYECLDIHRLMLGAGRKSRIMRWIERHLLTRTDLVIVSSPAFADSYFAGRQRRHKAVLLVENKVPVEARMRVPIQCSSAADRDGGQSSDARSIWTIGWFGMLRCKRTLQQLAELTRLSGGRIKVMIAGIASPAEFPDFAAQVAACPGMRYLGVFRQADLPRLYGAVDFVWAIDYFEEGLNSSWLLPNRLYEGLANGAVPIALHDVETGRWLQHNGVGLLVDDPVAGLWQRLEVLSPLEHVQMCKNIKALPEDILYQTRAERQKITAAIMGHAHA